MPLENVVEVLGDGTGDRDRYRTDLRHLAAMQLANQRVARPHCRRQLAHQRAEERFAQRGSRAVDDRLDGLGCTPLRAHVVNKDGDPGHAPVAVQNRVVGLVLADLPAVGEAKAALDLLALPLQGARKHALQLGGPLRYDQPMHVVAQRGDEAVVTLDCLAQGVVHHDHAQVAVHRQEQVVGVVDQRRQQRLFGAQRFLGALARRDVLHQQEHALLPVDLGHLNGEQRIPQLTGFLAERRFALAQGAQRQQILDAFSTAPGAAPQPHLHRGGADDFLARAADHLEEGGIGVDEGAVGRAGDCSRNGALVEQYADVLRLVAPAAPGTRSQYPDDGHGGRQSSGQEQDVMAPGGQPCKARQCSQHEKQRARH